MSPLQKYHSWAAKAQTWEYIENRHITDWGSKHTKLLELVRHIKNSDLSQRLFGSTSMDKLVVSIYDTLDYRKEALNITFNTHTSEWHFEYFAMPFQDPEFIRTYSEDKGIEKFDNFIKKIGW